MFAVLEGCNGGVLSDARATVSWTVLSQIKRNGIVDCFRNAVHKVNCPKNSVIYARRRLIFIGAGPLRIIALRRLD